LPDPSTVPVAMTAPEAFRIVNTDPGSPVPLIVGVESFVKYEGVTSPPALVIVGVVGRRESIVNTVVVGVLVLPAMSTSVTLYVFDHSGRGVVGVKL
jgi:hypothetical protein